MWEFRMKKMKISHRYSESRKKIGYNQKLWGTEGGSHRLQTVGKQSLGKECRPARNLWWWEGIPSGGDGDAAAEPKSKRIYSLLLSFQFALQVCMIPDVYYYLLKGCNIEWYLAVTLLYIFIKDI